MQRRCQVIKLRPEAREEYIRIHANVWPSVLAMIAASNIRNYSIYLYGDLLVSYFEYHGTDFDADMRRMGEDAETQRWWKLTDPMQAQVPEAGPESWWHTLPEVFHVD